ncbi:MAG: hypothetical protein PVF56_25590 [Desulfobacterales bacterium]|jgi:hypothetical protein
MKKEHKAIQKWVKNQYSDYFTVEAESVDGQNPLPDKKSHIYQPDVLLRKRKSKNIAYIIEVENDLVRKALVGASVLADYCIGKMQKVKPALVFVIYSREGIKQIPNFREKIKIAKKYCKNLKNIRIFSTSEFKKFKVT